MVTSDVDVHLAECSPGVRLAGDDVLDKLVGRVVEVSDGRLVDDLRIADDLLIQDLRSLHPPPPERNRHVVSITTLFSSNASHKKNHVKAVDWVVFEFVNLIHSTCES